MFPHASQNQYITALRAEIKRHIWSWRPETIFVGGGTPSLLEPAVTADLLALIPGRPWVEATVEAAPGTLTPEKAISWRNAGINRVSLGVQSFIDREIARTGRKHSAATVVSDVELLRNSGIGNINIDLIAGLPGQTMGSWQESLEWLDRLDLPHVSIYMLEVDEDSRLGKEMLLGGVRYGASDAPSEELTADLYETAVERLRQMGLRRYEISNFARPGRESRHNLKYWLLEPYVGFGADAHSFDGTMRCQNSESMEQYVEANAITRDTANPEEERFFVGLRLTTGVQPTPADWQRFDVPIHRFLTQGLLKKNGNSIRLTDRGILLSNEVFQEFLPV